MIKLFFSPRLALHAFLKIQSVFNKFLQDLEVSTKETKRRKIERNVEGEEGEGKSRRKKRRQERKKKEGNGKKEEREKGSMTREQKVEGEEGEREK